VDASTALAYLTIDTDAAVAPVLSSIDLDMLLYRHARTTDADLLEPDDDDWTPTYSESGLRAAAGNGWMLKAGRLKDSVKVGVGTGKTFELQQEFEHCLTMAASFGVGPSATATSGSGGGRSGIGAIGVYTSLGVQP
jgi:hypothetical protein